MTDILKEADTIINGDREKTYGHPSKNLAAIAAYWSIHINTKYNKNITLTVDDVCGMMVLMKQARLANDPYHHDSMVDIAGYIALQNKCQEANSAINTVATPKTAVTGTAIPSSVGWIPCTIEEFNIWDGLVAGDKFKINIGTLDAPKYAVYYKDKFK